MITETKMWTANCDSCNVNYELWDGCVALNEKTAISDDIKDAGEWVITKDGKTYCSDCHQTCWDDEKDENQVFSKDTQNSGAVLLGIED
jgi:hypothetical protein